MKKAYKKINELAEKYRDYTAQNLSNLVKIKSLSMQEKEVQIELKRQMEEAGFDVSGKMLASGSATVSSYLVLSLSGYNKGIYLVKMKAGNKIYSGKIIKQ